MSVVSLSDEIAAVTGRKVINIEALGGGCVSSVYRIRFDTGPSLIAKVDEDGLANLPDEAFMLRYLTDSTSLPVPEVIFDSENLLLMTFVDGDCRFSHAAEGHAAELLAALHSISSPSYGFERDTLIGGLRQPNPVSGSWIAFFRDYRLLYMAGEALGTGRLPHSVMERVERLCSQVENFLFEPEKPALIHGDVWTTNVLAVGDRVTTFLDPAIYFGHEEIELAFITLFHTFGRSFFDRYKEIRPILPGFFEERRHIYNLYPLLVHVRLFGGSYVSSVANSLDQLGF